MPEPVLDIRNLRFRYARSRADADDAPAPATPHWIVDIRQLWLDPGEQMLLTAASGRGKSTLLYLIAGLIDPAPDPDAHVRVAGADILSLRGHRRDLHRGRSIGMIFQTFNLLHGFSALENIMAAMMFSTIPRHDHEPRARALLRRLDIRRPDARPDQLSVGQQQRVAVARAVACDPPLVLADEPTASLDPENAAGAMDLIQQVCREKNAALLCVSHDPSMRDRFDRQTSLDQLAAPVVTPATPPPPTSPPPALTAP